MALSNTEKRVLLVALRFFHHSGHAFVEMLGDGKEPLKQESWQQCKRIIAKLHKQIKESINDNGINKSKTS